MTGFEPVRPIQSLADFKSTAIDRYATPPIKRETLSTGNHIAVIDP